MVRLEDTVFLRMRQQQLADQQARQDAALGTLGAGLDRQREEETATRQRESDEKRKAEDFERGQEEKYARERESLRTELGGDSPPEMWRYTRPTSKKAADVGRLEGLLARRREDEKSERAEADRTAREALAKLRGERQPAAPRPGTDNTAKSLQEIHRAANSRYLDALQKGDPKEQAEARQELDRAEADLRAHHGMKTPNRSGAAPTRKSYAAAIRAATDIINDADMRSRGDEGPGGQEAARIASEARQYLGMLTDPSQPDDIKQEAMMRLQNIGTVTSPVVKPGTGVGIDIEAARQESKIGVPTRRSREALDEARRRLGLR